MTAFRELDELGKWQRLVAEREGRGLVWRWQSGIRLWLAWVVTTAIGGAVGGIAIDTAGVVGAALFGAALGVFQWLVLRRALPRISGWVTITSLGGLLAWATLPVAMLVAILLDDLTYPMAQAVTLAMRSRTGEAPLAPTLAGIAVLDPRIAAASAGAVAGLVVGGLQGLILYRHSHRAHWWILASAASGALAGGVAGWDLLLWAVRRTGEALVQFHSSGLLAQLRGEWLALLRGGEIPPVPATWYLVWTPNGSVSGAVFAAVSALLTGIAVVWLAREQY